RDLKPENVVLVRGPGGEPWAKLIDFGIARLAREGPAALRQTGQGTVMGTPYYMSPEQARGSADIDARSDVYAVGVMLFEMIAGRLPFEGQSSDEILTKVLSTPFPSLRALEPSIPPALEYVVQTATQRKREERYGTALEFAEALRPLRVEMVAVRMLTAEEEAQLLDEDGPSSIRRLEELAARLPELAPSAGGPLGPPHATPSQLVGPRLTPPRVPSRPPTPSGAPLPRTTPRPATPPGVGPRTGRFPAVQPRITPRPSAPPPGSDAALIRSTGGHPALTPVRVSSRPSQPPPGGEPSQPGLRSTPAGERRPSYTGLRADTIPPGHTALVLPRRALFLLLVIGTALVAASIAALLIALSVRKDDARPPAGLGVETQGARVAMLPAPTADAGASAPTDAASGSDEGASAAMPDAGGGDGADEETGPNGAADAGPALEAANEDAPNDDATPPPAVTVRMRNLPRGARATVDGAPVERAFELPLDGVEHVLRVAAPGFKTFELPFVPAEGLVLTVRMERGRGTPDGGTTEPAADAGTAPGTDARAPLANPFGTR
ncbi:MAG: protein kinase, partial [Deltaproteobacteria bacterium]|nr:protein kinase [Deltaproteobacteria bacterium]